MILLPLPALAMDRASVRRRDVNGYLHVEVSNISKANVCPYYGREIPGWREMGLDANRVYRLYRDPEELARAAPTFNNLPLLSEHVPVSDEAFPEDLIVGCTGSHAEFADPFLMNSLAIWPKAPQVAIDRAIKRELSSSYRYRADMTPGLTPDGLRYEGVMRDIVGNHVALVVEGRAGPDVVVGDELVKLTSRTALMVSGAVAAAVRPLLAQDAKVDISNALKGVDAKFLAEDGAPKEIAGKVAELVQPHLAADAEIDVEALESSIAAIQPVAVAEDSIAEPAPKQKAKPKKAAAITVAADGDPDEEDDADGETAMDAATVKRMIDDAEKRGAATVAAIDLAKKDVAPLVGEIVGMDSAEAIYGFALDSAGYDRADFKDAPVSTLKAMVAREVDRLKPQRLAQDSVATKQANDSFAELYGSN